MSVKKFPPFQQRYSTKEIVTQINNLGIDVAAKHYAVSKRTLLRWLKSEKYTPKRIYVKEAANQH